MAKGVDVKKVLFTVAILLAVLTLKSQAIVEFNKATINLLKELDGADIYAQDKDKTYLGSISNKYDPNSILNSYGSYGSKYSLSSIWNEYGNFGGKYGMYSPFNKYSSPPMIIKNNKLVGYLSVSSISNNNLNPNILRLFEE